ncbi:hypothetical protein ABPG72_010364 [Tetrahymena utriculariae]
MSVQYYFPLLDINTQQLESLQKEVLIPLPHVLQQVQSDAKFDQIQQRSFQNNNLLKILDHNDECFRSYILTGENLPLIVLLKPRNNDSEMSQKNQISHEQMMHFAENANIEIFFKKKDKDTFQTQILPIQSPYFYSNSYIESLRVSQREIESLYIMNKSAVVHSYAYEEITQTLLLLIFVPIHLPSDQLNEKLYIELEFTCESQVGKSKLLQDNFAKSEEKFIDFLSRERDVFFKPQVFETKIQKNIIFVNPFFISQYDYQLAELNYIQISIKYNSLMENYIDLYRKSKIFLLKNCKLTEQVKIQDQTFLLDQIDFALNKSQSLFIQEMQSNSDDMIAIRTLDNYFTYKILQNKATDEKIKIFPFCEYTFVLIIEKQQNAYTQELQNYKFLVKCDQCKHNQLNQNSQYPNPSSKKNSLISLQPVVKNSKNNLQIRKASNHSIDEISQMSGNSLKSGGSTSYYKSQHNGGDQIRSLSKSQSAIYINTSAMKRPSQLQSPKSSEKQMNTNNKLKKQFYSSFTDSNTIYEYDEKQENGVIQNDCQCQYLMNLGLNLNNSTHLIIRWAHQNSYQKLYTITQYKIIWSHKGSDILQIKLQRRKDYQLQVNQFYHLKMTVKNLTSRPLDLKCKLPVKISSKLNSEDTESKVVAICKESILEIGLINPDQEIQTSFEYYLLSEGSFRLNHFVFFDKITQKDIKVEINIFELIK